MDLDMSDAFDADIMDPFYVTRQAQSLVLGRTVVTPSTLGPFYGTFCAAGPNDLQRLPEGITFTRGVSIVTQAKLQGAGVVGAQEYQPDVIEWNGGQYLVKHVDIYAHVGSGFWQVLAESMNAQEPN